MMRGVIAGAILLVLISSWLLFSQFHQVFPQVVLRPVLRKGRVVRDADLPWIGVSHDPEIKKQVLLQRAALPDQLTGVHRSVFKPGQFAPSHSHNDMFEVFRVVRGSGVFTIDEEPVQVQAGTTVTLFPGQTHEVRAGPDDEMELFYFGLLM